MAPKSTPNKLRIRSITPSALENFDDRQWEQFERVAQAIRSLGSTSMTHAQAERLAKRFGVHRATVYRYRARLQEIDAASAVAGRKRGWKPAPQVALARFDSEPKCAGLNPDSRQDALPPRLAGH